MRRRRRSRPTRPPGRCRTGRWSRPTSRGAGPLNLPQSARFDVILKTPKDGNLGAALNAAMEAIEAAFPPLAGQPPKD
jgi:hypothetical protein